MFQKIFESMYEFILQFQNRFLSDPLLSESEIPTFISKINKLGSGLALKISLFYICNKDVAVSSHLCRITYAA